MSVTDWPFRRWMKRFFKASAYGLLYRSLLKGNSSVITQENELIHHNKKSSFEWVPLATILGEESTQRTWMSSSRAIRQSVLASLLIFYTQPLIFRICSSWIILTFTESVAAFTENVFSHYGNFRMELYEPRFFDFFRSSILFTFRDRTNYFHFRTFYLTFCYFFWSHQDPPWIHLVFNSFPFWCLPDYAV